MAEYNGQDELNEVLTNTFRQHVISPQQLIEVAEAFGILADYGVKPADLVKLWCVNMFPKWAEIPELTRIVTDGKNAGVALGHNIVKPTHVSVLVPDENNVWNYKTKPINKD